MVDYGILIIIIRSIVMLLVGGHIQFSYALFQKLVFLVERHFPVRGASSLAVGSAHLRPLGRPSGPRML